MSLSSQKTIRFQIINPGGNTTALVTGIMPTKKERKLVNDRIMKKFPNVEQVGFVPYQLNMAGGEFCANATRAAAYSFLNGRFGQTQIKVSGSKTTLAAGVDSRGTWTEVPIYRNPQRIQRRKKFYLVKMQGITHIVCKAQYSTLSQKEMKKKALVILKKFELLTSIAAGVIFLQKTRNYYSIKPVVWVREVQTLICETACGSGSVAVAMIESAKKKKPTTLRIKQPSGSFYTVSVDFRLNKFEKAILSGPVTTDMKGEISL